MLAALCGLPLYCVSGFILHHTAAKIKRFIKLRHGFQPLLGCQLQFHPCAGGASVPLWSMGTACRPIEEYMGRRPHWRVFGRCRGIRSSRPPGADVGRALAPLYPSREKSAAGGQTATGAGRVSVPPLSLSLKGTRRASGGMSRRAVRAPGSAARQVPG